MSNDNDDVVRCIVSGGQTGVDRGALDAAIALGLEHGGWCPRGRLAEDGPIPERYRLRQTESAEYRGRTEQNVIDSDGTLILYRHRLFGGTELTRRFALKHQKLCCVVDLEQEPDVTTVRQWIADHSIGVLNVAGPRESSSPGIGVEAQQFVCSVFSEVNVHS